MRHGLSNLPQISVRVALTWEESTGKFPLPPPPPLPSLNLSVIMRFPNFGELMRNYVASAGEGLVVPAVGVLTK
jgi:hypothetical protein